jgi:hypothetical protein
VLDVLLQGSPFGPWSQPEEARMVRKALWLLAVLWWCVFWWCAPPVRAMAAPAAAELQRLLDFSVWVARVSANEGALKNRPEVALVWQTARSSARTTEKRAAWLAKHSPRVHGTRPCKVGNCFWTPNLTRSAAMPDGLRIPVDYWTVKVAPLWVDTLRYSDWLVLGNRTSDDPCHVTPKTWGCEQDRARALREGLYPIGCTRTLDDGFTYAKYCWSGGRWVCDPRFEPGIQSDRPSDVWQSLAVLR